MSNTKPKAVRKPRKKLNRYRAWFKDGESTVILAEYPNQVYDLVPPQVSMKIVSVEDDLE